MEKGLLWLCVKMYRSLLARVKAKQLAADNSDEKTEKEVQKVPKDGGETCAGDKRILVAKDAFRPLLKAIKPPGLDADECTSFAVVGPRKGLMGKVVAKLESSNSVSPNISRKKDLSWLNNKELWEPKTKAKVGDNKHLKSGIDNNTFHHKQEDNLGGDKKRKIGGPPFDGGPQIHGPPFVGRPQNNDGPPFGGGPLNNEPPFGGGPQNSGPPSGGPHKNGGPPFGGPQNNGGPPFGGPHNNKGPHFGGRLLNNGPHYEGGRRQFSDGPHLRGQWTSANRHQQYGGLGIKRRDAFGRPPPNGEPHFRRPPPNGGPHFRRPPNNGGPPYGRPPPTFNEGPVRGSSSKTGPVSLFDLNVNHPDDIGGPPAHKRSPPSAGELDKNKVLEEQLEMSVTPLCKLSAGEQLLSKQHVIQTRVLPAIKSEIIEANAATNVWFSSQENNNGFCCVDLHQILPSPLLEGYRNKCDFVVGTNPDTKELTLGFLVDNSTSHTGPIDHLRNVSGRMKHVVSLLQSYMRSTGIPAFDMTTAQGHWMLVTMRLTCEGQLMLLVSFNPQNLTKLQLKPIKEQLLNFVTTNNDCQVTSLYFNARCQWDTGTLEHMFGSQYVVEHMMGKQFRISPRSPFAVNTPATTIMHAMMADMVQLDRHSSLVDICCGTGPLGLCLAERCGQVVGVDICQQAIDDARHNALANNVTNCEFFSGSAEETLPAIFRRLAFSKAICVIDPPRSGLSAKAINHIRKNKAISKVLFVTSDPLAVLKNFADFARTQSNTYKGDPFVPVKAVPVDMYPHTKNFTVVFLLMRLKTGDLLHPESVNVDSYYSSNVNKEKDDSSLPEFQSFEQPPDLAWKPVNPPAAAAAAAKKTFKNYFNRIIEGAQTVAPPANPHADEPGLSSEQNAWLKQMTEVYGADFDRISWINTFLTQNEEASRAALAPVVAPPMPVQPVSSTSEDWAAYSKQYSDYMEWWSKHGNASGYPTPFTNNFPNMQTQPLPGSDPVQWKAYCQQMAQYWAQWAATADNTKTVDDDDDELPPLPKGPPPEKYRH